MDAAGARRLAEPISLEDHLQGRFDAPITLVQYGDYECPYTRLSRLSVRSLQREYAERLRFVFRHFPRVGIHPHARLAAAAAEAAAAQGEFWKMHAYLFAHQQALEASDLQRYAAVLGLDRDRFELDRATPETASRVNRDLASGERGGVAGTPTFYVSSYDSSQRHDGPYTVKSLRAAIESALGRTPGRT
jgi:protein-disulfide isomerase